MNSTITVLVVLAGGAVLAGCAAVNAPSQVSLQSTLPRVTIAQDGPCCGLITPMARAVLKVLDESNVEHLWLKSVHVAWDTGEPDMSPGNEAIFARIDHKNTHCSAFAAAMAKRLGVYMLRPPQHTPNLLASAQTEWFANGGGRAEGWIKLADSTQAQAMANAGMLVVVSFASPDPHRPGHIAIVRASERTVAQLHESGPLVTQAGDRNWFKTTTLHAFKYHPGAWPNGVQYFAHPLSGSVLGL